MYIQSVESQSLLYYFMKYLYIFIIYGILESILKNF